MKAFQANLLNVCVFGSTTPGQYTQKRYWRRKWVSELSFLLYRRHCYAIHWYLMLSSRENNVFIFFFCFTSSGISGNVSFRCFECLRPMGKRSEVFYSHPCIEQDEVIFMLMRRFIHFRIVEYGIFNWEFHLFKMHNRFALDTHIQWHTVASCTEILCSRLMLRITYVL